MQNWLFYALKYAAKSNKRCFLEYEGKFYEARQCDYGYDVWDIREINPLKVPRVSEEDREGYDE
jgi:hypothetical protein